ncbi:MAG TPA: DoxX family protein [Candidatus Polarisedimenticolaceae bacterium]|nr:DoxX family protein [Candidatus Polarisedimenticolaceae bacterium]
MERWLGRYSDAIYAVMRVVLGFLFACHGAQKLFGALGGQAQLSSPKMLTAGVIELVGGALIAIGLWAGTAAFLASGEMAAAYFIAHAPGGFWPILNRGELSAVYSFIFLYIASRGSGRYSVEAALTKPGGKG